MTPRPISDLRAGVHWLPRARRRVVLSVLAGFLFGAPATGAWGDPEQLDRSDFPEPGITSSAPSGWSAIWNEADGDPLSRQPQTRRRAAIVIGAGTIGLAAYGYSNWWRDGFVGRFRTVDEGWFGSDTDAGGTDKLGHAYSNYVGTRLLTWTFAALGNDRAFARRLGLVTTVAAFTAVEVIDGFSRKWRFSKEDAIMNAAGAGLGYLVETHPNLDQLIDFRLLYRGGTRNGKRDQWDPLGDYSGQTYLLTLKASGIPSMRNRGLFRYLELAIGYRAHGFEVVNGSPGERSRHIYYGVSLNVAEILHDTVFRNRHGSRSERIADGILEFVQIPGTAAFADRRF